jgi:hypothetical protein
MPGRKKIDPELIERAVEMYVNGFTQEECADAVGCSKQTVSTELKRRGIKVRQRGGAAIRRNCPMPRRIVKQCECGADAETKYRGEPICRECLCPPPSDEYMRDELYRAHFGVSPLGQVMRTDYHG